MGGARIYGNLSDLYGFLTIFNPFLAVVKFVNSPKLMNIMPLSVCHKWNTFHTGSYFSRFSVSDGLGYDSSRNCSRYWHVFDFDASTAKFKIYQNSLMNTAPVLPKKSIVNPNCSCTGKHEVSSDDVLSSAKRISITAKNLMVDKLCVNEMKNIYDNASRSCLLC